MTAMIVCDCAQVFQNFYHTVKKILSRITELFLKTFCLRPEEPPEKINKPVVNLSDAISPNLYERQGHLIRQKSLVEKSVLENGLSNQFNTHHIVAKIGDTFVKTDPNDNNFQKPLALLEKLAWNVAQILGDEANFAATNTVLLHKSCLIELKQGEISTRYFRQAGVTTASYQIDAGVVLANNYNQLNNKVFDDIFILVLIYGMYDSHNSNILVKDGRPIFFDNPRILPPTNDFLINCYGSMLPLRLELMGDRRASSNLDDKTRQNYIDHVGRALSRIETLNKYLNDPVIQTQFEDLPLSWFDAEKSFAALKERLEILKKTLDGQSPVAYNDLAYAIYPKLKLYAALVFRNLLERYPSITYERACMDIGYTCLSDCFKNMEREAKIKIAVFDPSDSLELIFKKTKAGLPYAWYAIESLEKDFSEKEIKAPSSIPDGDKYKLYAALVYRSLLTKYPSLNFNETQAYLGTRGLRECFKVEKSAQEVKIAQFEPSDTLEDIFRKTKEGPHVEYSKDSREKDFLKGAQINLIEEFDPIYLVNSRLPKLLGSETFQESGLYKVKGVTYTVDQRFIPGEFVIIHKGACLPPMPLEQFKQWLLDGEMFDAQKNAMKQIDALGAGVHVHFIFRKEQASFLARLRYNQTVYIQRRFGKKFVIKRAHRDLTGKIHIEPVNKAKEILPSQPTAIKNLVHKEAEIVASRVPGYYIAKVNEVTLPPMTEEELNEWFKSDRKEYFHLKKYKDHGAQVYSKSAIEALISSMVDGSSNLYQIWDSRPVQHVYHLCEGNEIFVFDVKERGDSVGYLRDGKWVELFKL